MPRELRDGDVHAEADAEVRDAALSRDAAGEDLPLPAPRAEAAGHEHAVHLLELALGLLERHAFGVDPAHVHVAAVMDARVLQRLVHGEVGVVELHVLADEGDLDGRVALADASGQRLPLAKRSPGPAPRPSFSQTSESRPCSRSASGTR